MRSTTSTSQQNEESMPTEIVLPHLPRQVKLEDIKCIDENGNAFILTPNEINEIKKELNRRPDKRYRKEELNKFKSEGKLKDINYSVIKQAGKYYAVYKGIKYRALVGVGSFGAVKLAQDLDTGEWVALKIQRKKSDYSKYLVAGEYAKLCRTKQAKGYFFDVSKKKGEQYCILMTFVDGQTLLSFITNLTAVNRNLPTARWLQIARDMCSEVDNLHDQYRILHRDIKTENYMYNYATGKVSIIDLGLAYELGEGEDEITDRLIGTEYTQAPESHERPHKYSPKSDAYSVGISIAELLRFLDDEDKLINTSHHLFNENKKIKDPNLRREILEYLHKLTDEDPYNRPTLKEAQKFFHDLQHKFLSLPARMATMGLFNIDEYHRSDLSTQQNMRNALIHFDEVVIVDIKDDRNRKEYLSIKRDLQSEGIAVGNRIFVGSDLESTISKIPEKIESSSPSSLVHVYAYVTHDDEIQSLPESEVSVLARHSKPLDYAKAISGITLTKMMFVKVTGGLHDEIQRLQEKYTKNGKIDDKVAESRIKKLKAALQFLEDKFNKDALGYQDVDKKLVELQNQMTHTGTISRVTPFFNSAGRNAISTIRSNVRRSRW